MFQLQVLFYSQYEGLDTQQETGRREKLFSQFGNRKNVFYSLQLVL